MRQLAPLDKKVLTKISKKKNVSEKFINKNSVSVYNLISFAYLMPNENSYSLTEAGHHAVKNIKLENQIAIFTFFAKSIITPIIVSIITSLVLHKLLQ